MGAAGGWHVQLPLAGPGRDGAPLHAGPGVCRHLWTTISIRGRKSHAICVWKTGYGAVVALLAAGQRTGGIHVRLGGVLRDPLRPGAARRRGHRPQCTGDDGPAAVGGVDGGGGDPFPLHADLCRRSAAGGGIQKSILLRLGRRAVLAVPRLRRPGPAAVRHGVRGQHGGGGLRHRKPLRRALRAGGAARLPLRPQGGDGQDGPGVVRLCAPRRRHGPPGLYQRDGPPHRCPLGDPPPTRTTPKTAG